MDDFTWERADVNPCDESGKKLTWGYSCSTMESALKRKDELLLKYQKVIVRDNARREEKIYVRGSMQEGIKEFSLKDLSALEKLYFFVNSQYEVHLPSSENYCWVNENNEICMETAKLDRKMTYTRVDKGYDPTTTPTSIPTILPTQSPTSSPSASPVVPSDAHIFSDCNYSNPVTDGSIVVYGNGMTKKINGKKINNRVSIVYTDILASYRYTANSKGIIKPSIGKVVVAVTKSATKPTINNKNKVTDTSASKMAKAKIKNGQITVTAVGKEGGTAYLWVMDTGSKGVSACCPVNVKLAPKKLEVQNATGSKVAKNTELKKGKTFNVYVAGFVGSTKTADGTYTAVAIPKYSSYVIVTPATDSKNKFTITANGLKNDKKTKVFITFMCDQNNKKTKLSLTLTK